MKRSILAFIILSVFSCNNQSSKTVESKIYGKWEVDSLSFEFENTKNYFSETEILQMKNEINISSIGSKFEFTSEGKSIFYPSDASRKLYDSKPETSNFRIEHDQIISIQNGIEDKNRSLIISNSNNSMCLKVIIPTNSLTENSGLENNAIKLYLSKIN